MQDTRSMFWLYVFENGLSIMLALALYPALGVGGLALAWVGAYSVAAVAASVHLRGRTGGLEGRATADSLLRIGIATAVMAGAVVAVLRVGNPSSNLKAPLVVLAVGAGTLVYVAVGRLLGLTELRAVVDLRRRTR
jgi:putative peptidoglycan lipid II flippase